VSDSGPNSESFEETVRAIAGALGRYVQLAVETVDLDHVAESIGVDAVIARDWVENTGSWLRANTERVGDEFARQLPVSGPGPDLLGGAAPHPLDLPTDEQGLALAALDSGRWLVEPGTDALTAKGDGPGPTDALGVVRELRVRDWIAVGGGLTLAGRHALTRWLVSADSAQEPSPR
jgi:hypothetical protein